LQWVSFCEPEETLVQVDTSPHKKKKLEYNSRNNNIHENQPNHWKYYNKNWPSAIHSLNQQLPKNNWKNFEKTIGSQPKIFIPKKPQHHENQNTNKKHLSSFLL